MVLDFEPTEVLDTSLFSDCTCSMLGIWVIFKLLELTTFNAVKYGLWTLDERHSSSLSNASELKVDGPTFWLTVAGKEVDFFLRKRLEGKPVKSRSTYVCR